MKKKIFIIISLVLFCFTINVDASTKTYERTNDNLLVPDYIEVTDSNRSNVLLTPAVNADEKIYDYADLFSDSEEDKLYEQVKKFYDNTNYDLAVVTIDYNNKHSPSVYANDFYDYNAFGRDAYHSGLLFLIDMENRQIYVSTTGLAIDTYSDSRINSILDSVFSYMSDGEYYEGASKFIGLAHSYVGVAKSDDKEYIISDGELVKKNYLVPVLFISFIVTLVAILIMVRMNHLVFKASSSKEYLKKDTQRINRTNEVFLGSHISKVRIDNSSSHGGGSSTHSGSSGISHGGGGHRF